MIQTISDNIQHNDQSAGRLASNKVPRAQSTDSVTCVISELETLACDYDAIDYVYIVDNDVLTGIVSIHELLISGKNIPVADIMTTDIASVHSHTDQEHVAHLALAQNIKAVPVIDDDGSFIGVITADTILQILRDEHTEDILTFAGLSLDHNVAIETMTLSQHLKSRLPWLILGLGGGVLAAVIVESFSHTIAREVVLAAFIPAVVYIADAVGSQTQMIYVRSLNTFKPRPVIKVLSRELTVATFLGLILSAVIFAISYIWLQSTTVSLILAIAILGTVFFSTVVAILLPWSFVRTGHDPAVASGPLATVIRDVSSLCIYFLIAILLL